jgi:hypothetical protein
MFRLLLAVAVTCTAAAADGVALIEFENPTSDPVEATVGEKKYTVKAKSSQKVFLSPGRYECAWGDKKTICDLKHGDITVITLDGSKAVAKPKDEQPKGIVVVDPKDILGPRPAEPKKGVDPQPLTKEEDKNKRPVTPTPVDTSKPKDQDVQKPPTKRVEKIVDEAVKPRPPPEEKKPLPNSAVVKFLLPEGAKKLWIDGEKKEVNGRNEIVCHTPTLRVGQSYYYDITLELSNNTRYLRRVYVFANQTTTVDFR